VRQSGSSLQDREAGWHLRAVLSTLHTHTYTHTHTHTHTAPYAPLAEKPLLTQLEEDGKTASSCNESGQSQLCA